MKKCFQRSSTLRILWLGNFLSSNCVSLIIRWVRIVLPEFDLHFWSVFPRHWPPVPPYQKRLLLRRRLHAIRESQDAAAVVPSQDPDRGDIRGWGVGRRGGWGWEVSPDSGSGSDPPATLGRGSKIRRGMVALFRGRRRRWWRCGGTSVWMFIKEWRKRNWASRLKRKVGSANPFHISTLEHVLSLEEPSISWKTFYFIF